MAYYESKDEDDFGLTHNPIISMHNGSDNNSFGYHEQGWFFYSTNIVCPFVILGGILANLLALVVVVRSRLWLKYEGYFYLAAIFCANIGILLMYTNSFWMTFLYGNGQYYPPNTSNFMCKVWHFLEGIIRAPVCLSVALLFNVYLREHLTQRRRCGCPMFATKYCTLFATKIIVGVIFGVLFVLGIPSLAIYEFSPDGECFPSQRGSLYAAQLVKVIFLWTVPYVAQPIIPLIIINTGRKGNTLEPRGLDDRSAYAEQMQVSVLALALFFIIELSQIGLVFLDDNYLDNVVAYVVIGMTFAVALGLQPIMCFIILKTLRDGFRSQLRNIR